MLGGIRVADLWNGRQPGAQPDGGDAAVADARALAARMPELRTEARRVAATVIAGSHGRSHPGQGEDFWQFRPFISGESARLVDWRRSGRDQHLYVRETELQNAHTVWLHAALSPSMQYASAPALPQKARRAVVLVLALAQTLAEGGERTGILGQPRPASGSNALGTIARDIAKPAGPLAASVRRRHEIVIASDFMSAHTAKLLDDAALSGARLHLLQVLDPAEEAFPFTGRTEFVDPETGARLTAGRAETLRADYLSELARHRQELQDRARASGGSFILHHTDHPATVPLFALGAGLRGAGRQ